jgi:hypothetical protein
MQFICESVVISGPYPGDCRPFAWIASILEALSLSKSERKGIWAIIMAGHISATLSKPELILVTVTHGP